MTTIADLFLVEYGNKLDMNKMSASDREFGTAFVGRIGGLNGKSGVAGFVEPVPGLQPYPAGLLTVALGGSRLLSTYVQQRPFYTAQNVAVLTPLDQDMPLLHRLYYAMCIRANAFRYSAFGREANRTLSEIELPTSIPSWVGLAALPTVDGMASSLEPRTSLPERRGWKPFRLDRLFEVKKGKRVTKANRQPGDTRFIGASEKNNGVTDMCDLDPIFPAHTLSVPYNGSVGFAFYQAEPYFASDDVQVLIPRTEVTRDALLFVATMIRYEKDRFTYGYKWHLERMRATTVLLPALDDETPDWATMDRYMRGLPFSSAIAA
jgi:hypothetical protein